MIPRTLKQVGRLPVVLAVAFAAGLPGWLWVASDGYGAQGAHEEQPGTAAACPEALRFTRLDPPAGLRDGKCELKRTQDGRPKATGAFRMEHRDVDAWLASFPQPAEPLACPGPHPDNYDPESEGCVALVYETAQPGRAAGLRMRITPEVGTTATVRFQAE
ncbi:hypothetical protein ACFTWH_00925 [Streptomyces sp. NPDC057011]|uniref:hypothetical protein n=1 Tax=unclassified Streptomyces TaxID=2593676 RepID=UPI003626D73F